MVSSSGVSYHNFLKTGIFFVFNWKMEGREKDSNMLVQSLFFYPSFPPEDKHRPTIRNVIYNASKVMEMAHNTCQAWFVLYHRNPVRVLT